MRVLLIPIGSHGDVHPFVSVGRALKDRGHSVTVITNPHFEGLVARLGLEFAPLGTEQQFLEAIANVDLWSPMEGFRTVLRYTADAIEPVFDLIRERYEPGNTVVGAQVTAYGARVAQEVLGVPMATIHLQPAVILSAIEPPVLPMYGLLRRLPVAARRWFFRLADRQIVDPLLAPRLNAFRRQFGLEPISRVMQWWHSPRRVLGLFPEWFCPPQVDWPPNVVLTGFPLYDEQDLHGLPEDVAGFLDEGEPPVAFTAGSAMRHCRDFFEAAAHACVKTGRRGVLLTRFIEQVPAHLPTGVRHFSYVPFSRLFPRCAAVVHHGGIGTTAQALAAGSPHLVIPRAHDQPDNAMRLVRLGVGRTLSPGRVSASNLAHELSALLGTPRIRERCLELGARLEARDAVETVCLEMERLLLSAQAGAS
jgi:rhamnosyltransferase subunit B